MPYQGYSQGSVGAQSAIGRLVRNCTLLLTAVLWVGMMSPKAVHAADAPTGVYEVDEHTALLLHLDGDIKVANNDQPYFRTVGSLQWQPGPTDAAGQSLSLDGKSGFYAPVSAVYQMGQQNQSWTIETYFKPEKSKYNTAIVSVIAGHGRIVSLTLSKDGQLGLRTSASSYDLAGINSGDLSQHIYDGKWHHVAAVIDRERNGELRLYLDGKQLNTQGAYQHYPILFPQKTFNVTIGSVAPWYIAKEGYQGQIDEVRISSIARYAAAKNAPAPEPAPPAPTPIVLNANESRPIRLTADNVVIVSPRFGSAEEITAAGTIRQFLAKALKVEPKAIAGAADHQDDLFKDKFIISVGRTRALTDKDLEPLEPQGYLIKRKGRAILLATRNQDIMLVATERFLSELLGVRHYLPFDLFVSEPTTKPIVINDLNIASNPYVHISNSTGYSYYPDFDWVSMMGLDRSQGSHQHSMWARFPPDKFAKKYPKIYPTIDGKYYVPTSGRDQRWAPTLTEPTLMDAALESMDDYFTANPDAPFIAFSVQDSHVHSDIDLATPEVQKLGKTQGLSELYWRFLNDLALRANKKYPDKKIVGIAYAQVRMPPSFKLHENIVPWLVWKLSDETAAQAATSWVNIATSVGIHDWAQGSGFLMPRIYTNKLKQAFLDMENMGLPFRFTHGEAYPNWGMDGPKLYIMAQIWWNPHVDVDKVLKQFTDDMFGPASDPMYNYFKTLEEFFLIANGNQERKLDRYYFQFVLTSRTKPLADKARVLLDQAVALAKTPEQKQRIDLFNKTFKLTEMFFKLANAPYDQALADDIFTYAKDVIYPDTMTVYPRGTTMEAKLKNITMATSQIKGGAKKIADLKAAIEAKNKAANP